MRERNPDTKKKLVHGLTKGARCRAASERAREETDARTARKILDLI